MAKNDIENDDLLKDMTQAQALHLRYQIAQGRQVVIQEQVALVQASLTGKRNDALQKSEQTYQNRNAKINSDYEEGLEEQEARISESGKATSDAQHALVEQQELILQKYEAKIDLLDAKPRAGSVINV